ncbi:MocR-like pyridoxine biosynthesis transcription factor PdxR [Bradyrhizobium sp. AZCC 2262]|uniref:MocR-like pyridoxine biosynthesis transcription factor PdxR n=1 Tax=Bradyrhizobium sp. AZCC 2262 TaxID=3117022 RepID=UPI002FF0900D
MHRQLFERLKHAILSGQIQPGARLPSTRSLAAELNVSRNTIVTAYELLDTEGLIEAQIGGGTTVRPLSERRFDFEHRELDQVPFSHDPSTSVPQHAPFKVGVPAYLNFPMRAWNATVNRSARAQTVGDLAYQDTSGHIGLRRLLAAYLLTRRGLRCDVDQIVVVPGYQAGLNLVIRSLLQHGDQVWVEDPGHGPTRDTLRLNGMAARPVPIDADGMMVKAGTDLWPDAKLAVVTPAHQFPLGMSMSDERRRQLLDWARSSRAWIVEDDYDTEFHFAGKPPDSLAGTMSDERVVYIGTFSKVLFPSLRIGYAVIPPALVGRFSEMRQVMDGHQPYFMQDAVRRFIEEGSFDRHLGKMRALYRKRRLDLVAAIADRTNGRLQPIEAAGGTHLTALFEEGVDDVAFSEMTRRVGVETAPLASFRIRRGHPGLVLGYSACSPTVLGETMDRLKVVLSARRYPKAAANKGKDANLPRKIHRGI